MNQGNLDQQDIRAYTTYDDPETYHNMRTASIITVTGMNINDHVYHREEVDQTEGVRDGAPIARFVSLTGHVLLVSPDSSWMILSPDMKETASGNIQGDTDDQECTLQAGIANLSYVIPGTFLEWCTRRQKESPRIAVSGDWAKLQRQRDIRKNALRALILEPPGEKSTKTIGVPASSDVSSAQELVLSQEEQPRTSNQEELKDELKEELTTGPHADSTIQLKEHVADLSSDNVITTTASDKELHASEPKPGLDEMQELLSEINSITLDSYLLESGGDQGSYNKEELAHSPWTGEYDHESSPGLFTSPTPSYLKEEPPDVPLLEESLPPLSKGEPCAPTHAPDDNSNIKNFNYHYNIV